MSDSTTVEFFDYLLRRTLHLRKPRQTAKKKIF